VGSVMYYLLPFRLTVTGTTRSGGFQSSMVVDAVVKDRYSFDKLYHEIISIIHGYATAKVRGYLSMDGTVYSIQEPYRELYIKMRPLKRPFNNMELLMDKYMNMLKIYGEQSLLDRIQEFIEKPHEIPRKPLFTIIKYIVKKKHLAEKTCRDICERYGCDIGGYINTYWDYDVTVLIIPDTLPPRGIRIGMMPVCTCEEIHLYGDEYLVKYVYVDKDMLRSLGVEVG
ncbi:MAG: hypothetical protein GXO43_06865, partial [Crenarchaeota archaeon]|nr:hypothetical protein [Thermoproteota archaeon]